MHARFSVYLIVIQTYYRRRTPCRSPCSHEDRSWRRATLLAYRSDQSNSEVLPKDKIATNAVEVRVITASDIAYLDRGEKRLNEVMFELPRERNSHPAARLLVEVIMNVTLLLKIATKHWFLNWVQKMCLTIIFTHKVWDYRRHKCHVDTREIYNLEHVGL